MIALLWLSCVAILYGAVALVHYRHAYHVERRETEKLRGELKRAHAKHSEGCMNAFVRGAELIHSVHRGATLDDDDVPPVMRRREYMLGGTMNPEKQ